MSKSILQILNKSVRIEKGSLEILDADSLSRNIDKLIQKAVFGNKEEKAFSKWIIWEAAQELGIKPASIHNLYIAKGSNKIPLNFSVPAINMRGMAYDMARAIFSSAKKLKVGALIFEIARSEMGYCDQPPSEYTTVVLAAAIKSNWKGPVFIQGDHFQVKTDKPGIPNKGEVEVLKELMTDAISAGFYNIDIDTSTLVDLSKKTEKEQQESNVKHSILFAEHIRKNEPKRITVSIGGEIGHIGGKNSTVEEFKAYMDGFDKGLSKGLVGMSKSSVQTGTSHGGVVLPDGTLADVDIDFSVLEKTSKVGREKYQIGGAVQHGASTLPDKYFKQFPEAQAIEVHLATGFQNIIMDHPAFPADLSKKMYAWLDKEKIGEKKENQTTEQFRYKTRKKAWGQFKKECWSIDEKAKEKIRSSLEKRFDFMFKSLNVVDTIELINKFIKPVNIHKKPEDFGIDKRVETVRGLAD